MKSWVAGTTSARARQAWLLSGALLACGTDTERERELGEEVEAFVVEHEERAIEVCDAAGEDLSDEDSSSDAVRCYYELRFTVDHCMLEGLRAHPKEGRAYFECSKSDLDDLIACCEDGAACSYTRVVACRDSLWDGERSSTCDEGIELSEIDAYVEECRR